MNTALVGVMAVCVAHDVALTGCHHGTFCLRGNGNPNRGSITATPHSSTTLDIQYIIIMKVRQVLRTYEAAHVERY